MYHSPPRFFLDSSRNVNALFIRFNNPSRVSTPNGGKCPKREPSRRGSEARQKPTERAQMSVCALGGKFNEIFSCSVRDVVRPDVLCSRLVPDHRVYHWYCERSLRRRDRWRHRGCSQ